MTNTVLILAISIILVSVTFIPLAEAAVSWNGFLREIGFNPPSVYEVSGVSVIQAGGPDEKLGNEVQLRCLDGDWLYDAGLPFSMTAEPLADFEATSQIGVGNSKDIHESPSVITVSKLIGYDVTPKRNGIQQFDITVVTSILCLSPSTFQTVGGEWQATDTTALIIGYSVLNMYWIAPIAIGIGAGIYLTRNRLQKH